jgi:hypothetical protein
MGRHYAAKERGVLPQNTPPDYNTSSAIAQEKGKKGQKAKKHGFYFVYLIIIVTFAKRL